MRTGAAHLRALMLRLPIRMQVQQLAFLCGGATVLHDDMRSLARIFIDYTTRTVNVTPTYGNRPSSRESANASPPG